jgi:hypothetical protein
MNNSTTLSTPLESLRSLLAGSIDYAGLFPPSHLQMSEAVANYDGYRRGQYRWLLGRFVVPAARLDELRELALRHFQDNDEPWKLSVLSGEDVYTSLKQITAFNEANAGVLIADSIEVKANTVSKIENSVDAMPDGLTAFFEIGLSQTFADLVAALALNRQSGKIRTGGVTPEEFPKSRDIIRFVRTCMAANVPFKATAGLHHPIRCFKPLTYAEGGPSGTMHGFLNLFLMTGFARESFKPDILEELMEEEFGEVFTFDENGVTWRGEYELATWQLERIRRFGIRSFGSCSFEEPIEDLKALGLL